MASKAAGILAISMRRGSRAFSLKPHVLRCAFSTSRPIKLSSSLRNSQRMLDGPEEESSFEQELSPFEQDLKAVDPKVLADAMGGGDQPPEEPLFSTFEEGFGYFPDAAVGRKLGRYHFARKVRTWASPVSTVSDR